MTDKRHKRSQNAPRSPLVPPGTPYGLPQRFLERMQALLGAEFPAFAAVYDRPTTHGLRVNTLKLTPAQFEAISPFPLEPLPWSPAGFVVSEEQRPGKHPYHAAGLYYLQDAHAQAVGEILAAQPGERVLDLAASPGGKTTHLASRMQNRGVLVANEIKTKRIGHLAANLERWGVRNAAITNETPERLAEFFGPFFDRVLVDAPCSGEGMFRKDPASRADWSEEAVAGCAVRQTAILHYAARLVRPGGRLCYSTCTFAPEEDEEVIEDFLQEHPEFEEEACPISGDPLAREGRPGIRLWPHTSPGEGHFVALLRKTGTGIPATDDRRPPPDERRLPNAVRQLYEAFCREVLGEIPAIERLVQAGSRLYQLPEGLPSLDGLRLLHPGWWLGEIKTDRSGHSDRFEPAHTLALAGPWPRARTLALPPEDPALAGYLRGNTLRSSGEEGWLLVSVTPSTGEAEPLGAGPFPLGWGKRVQDIVKNHYPRGLQWL